MPKNTNPATIRIALAIVGLLVGCILLALGVVINEHILSIRHDYKFISPAAIGGNPLELPFRVVVSSPVFIAAVVVILIFGINRCWKGGRRGR